MADIITLTMNSAVDLSTYVDRVVPLRKLRCRGLLREPGGGGINVTRVVRRMGTKVTAVYTTGGTIGRLLRQLVERENIESTEVQVAAETRENFTAHEDASGQEYRFILAGPQISDLEWQACLDTLASLEPFPGTWLRAEVSHQAFPMISTRELRGAPGIAAQCSPSIPPENH